MVSARVTEALIQIRLLLLKPPAAFPLTLKLKNQTAEVTASLPVTLELQPLSASYGPPFPLHC